MNSDFIVLYKKGKKIPTCKDAEDSLRFVFNDLKDIKSRYISLGFHLDELKRIKTYEKLGFEDFYEFCEVNFHLDKSSVSRCMNVFNKFADYDSKTSSHKMWISDKYREYSYSQLVEMCSIKDKALLDMVSPGMSVRQIRDIKKVATSQQNDNDVKEFTIFDLFNSFTELLKNELKKHNVDFSSVYFNSKEVGFTIKSSPGMNYIPAGSYEIRLVKVKE